MLLGLGRRKTKRGLEKVSEGEREGGGRVCKGGVYSFVALCCNDCIGIYIICLLVARGAVAGMAHSLSLSAATVHNDGQRGRYQCFPSLMEAGPQLPPDAATATTACAAAGAGATLFPDGRCVAMEGAVASCSVDGSGSGSAAWRDQCRHLLLLLLLGRHCHECAVDKILEFAAHAIAGDI